MNQMKRRNRNRNCDWLDNTIEDEFFNSFIFPRSLFRAFEKSNKQMSGFPVYDIHREEDKTILEFALAGYDVSQLKVEVEGTTLTVSAERKEEAKEGSRIASRSFATSFEAKGFDLDNVDVSFVNGILKVVMPKIAPKELEIKKINIATE
jgi:HSP20 family protein